MKYSKQIRILFLLFLCQYSLIGIAGETSPDNMDESSSKVSNAVQKNQKTYRYRTLRTESSDKERSNYDVVIDQTISFGDSISLEMKSSYLRISSEHFEKSHAVLSWQKSIKSTAPFMLAVIYPGTNKYKPYNVTIELGSSSKNKIIDPEDWTYFGTFTINSNENLSIWRLPLTFDDYKMYACDGDIVNEVFHIDIPSGGFLPMLSGWLELTPSDELIEQQAVFSFSGRKKHQDELNSNTIFLNDRFNYIDNTIYSVLLQTNEVGSGFQFAQETYRNSKQPEYNKPKNPDFKYHEKRLNSLKFFSETNDQISIYNLADSGFFYLGRACNLWCFHCNAHCTFIFKNETADDCHKRISPGCQFLKNRDDNGLSNYFDSNAITIQNASGDIMQNVESEDSSSTPPSCQENECENAALTYNALQITALRDLQERVKSFYLQKQ